MLYSLVPLKPQGANSPTFVQPPLDFSLSFPEILEWNARHSHYHPLFRYSEGLDQTRTICWGEAIQGFRRASRYIKSLVNDPWENAKPRVIGILSSSGASGFFCNASSS